jgi:osmotically-inducible protein OsmY
MENEPKQYLVERLRTALAHDDRAGELDVHVRVLGARVYIQGTVATSERRDAVTTVAREVLPDHDVHNEMTVVGVTAPGEEERLA